MGTTWRSWQFLMGAFLQDIVINKLPDSRIRRKVSSSSDGSEEEEEEEKGRNKERKKEEKRGEEGINHCRNGEEQTLSGLEQPKNLPLRNIKRIHLLTSTMDTVF
ncbi:unnamed protein product [Brugia pahangi]|uniref:Uncharacterized protein n=1 Tax=Brugia pahangi TaxID=6280 RepID=A0A0N4T9D7_BRUPA|nr:unnamed protein product [Brugia pahangi]